MVLSPLQIRDLTHALSVSKYWQQTILGAIELRQTLLLEPVWAVEECLQYISGMDSRLGYQHPMPIFELHPILVTDKYPRHTIRTGQSYGSLHTVHRSTLLSRPPLVDVAITNGPHKFGLYRKEGLTFGGVIHALERKCYRLTGLDILTNLWSDLRHLHYDDMIWICADEVISKDSVYVQTARERAGDSKGLLCADPGLVEKRFRGILETN